MTDDEGKETAMDLVQRGFSDYVRKPPALPELKMYSGGLTSLLS